jgi:hypothetical protein
VQMDPFMKNLQVRADVKRTTCTLASSGPKPALSEGRKVSLPEACRQQYPWTCHDQVCDNVCVIRGYQLRTHCYWPLFATHSG